MAQRKIFKSREYFDNKGQRQFGIPPAEVEAFAKANPDLPNLPSAFGSNNNPVSSTQGIRDEETLNRNEASKLMTDIGNDAGSTIEQIDLSLGTTLPDLFSQTDQGKQSQGDIESLRTSLGITSDEEKQRIAEAGQSAFDSFSPLIAEAEQAKLQGVAKSRVGGGERGGFLNTQVSGVGALLPTNGGDFIGAGGELSRIKSEFDQVIQNAKARALAAKAAAEAGARKAIRTGKRQDLSDALNLRQQFQAESRDAIKLAQQKTDSISQILNEQRRGVQFSQNQEDRLVKQATEELNLLLDSADENVIENNRANIEKLLVDAGYDNVEVTSLIDSFKKKAIEANKKDLPKPELRTINGSLYSVDFNEETNQFDTKLVIAKKPSGGKDIKEGSEITLDNVGSAVKEMKSAFKGNDATTNEPLQGEDGFISPDTWLELKEQWKNQGGSAALFDEQFAEFRDPNNPNYLIG